MRKVREETTNETACSFLFTNSITHICLASVLFNFFGFPDFCFSAENIHYHCFCTVTLWETSEGQLTDDKDQWCKEKKGGV